MKVCEIHKGAGIDGLTWQERPDPQPGFGRILMRVRATALNYRDLIVARGNYPGQKSPQIPMSDGAYHHLQSGSHFGKVVIQTDRAANDT